jgi:hypothetical protein
LKLFDPPDSGGEFFKFSATSLVRQSSVADQKEQAGKKGVLKPLLEKARYHYPM